MYPFFGGAPPPGNYGGQFMPNAAAQYYPPGQPYMGHPQVMGPGGMPMQQPMGQPGFVPGHSHGQMNPFGYQQSSPSTPYNMPMQGAPQHGFYQQMQQAPEMMQQAYAHQQQMQQAYLQQQQMHMGPRMSSQTHMGPHGYPPYHSTMTAPMQDHLAMEMQYTTPFAGQGATFPQEFVPPPGSMMGEVASQPAPPEKKQLPSWLRQEILRAENDKIKQREKEIALELEQAKRDHVQRVPLTGYATALSPPDSPASPQDDGDVQEAKHTALDDADIIALTKSFAVELLADVSGVLMTEIARAVLASIAPAAVVKVTSSKLSSSLGALGDYSDSSSEEGEEESTAPKEHEVPEGPEVPVAGRDQRTHAADNTPQKEKPASSSPTHHSKDSREHRDSRSSRRSRSPRRSRESSERDRDRPDKERSRSDRDRSSSSSDRRSDHRTEDRHRRERSRDSRSPESRSRR